MGYIIDPNSNPQTAIGYLLQHVASVLGRQLDQALQEQLGIGMSQFRILMILQHHPEIRQRQLADHLAQTEASISRQIKLLHQKDMLTTRINPANKREHISEPTAKGLRITEAAQKVMHEYAAPAYETMSDKQQREFVSLLRAMHAWTCQPGKLTSCDHPFGL